jgi:hypothetical protein
MKAHQHDHVHHRQENVQIEVYHEVILIEVVVHDVETYVESH